MTTDLTTRITELTAAIGKRLAQDAAGAWSVHDVATCDALLYEEDMAAAADTPDCDCGHPARVLRRVAATRSLVTAIQAEQHDWNPLEEYYSCSQARENTGTMGLEIGPPGSGCSDPDRKGDPCDCGRNHRVARLLGIIASEWEA